MKAVMISIQPKWVELIANGEKTIEVRKTRPKLDTPFKCYIYATKSGDRIVLKNDRVYEIAKNLTGKVIGEFVCDEITKLDFITLRGSIKSKDLIKNACLNIDETKQYIGTKNGYGWHISDLVIYDEPKEIGEFKKPDCKCPFPYVWQPPCPNCNERDIRLPIPSWCYIEEKE